MNSTKRSFLNVPLFKLVSIDMARTLLEFEESCVRECLVIHVKVLLGSVLPIALRNHSVQRVVVYACNKTC